MKYYKKIFTEGGSQILFHSTNMKGLTGIIDSDSFRLSPGIVDVEDKFTPAGKYYYLSTSRVKFSNFANDTLSKEQATFVIDGRKIQNRYKILPVDYWKDMNSTIKDRSHDETEDRIFHSKAYIENASKYIKEIHINIRYKVKDSLIEKLKDYTNSKNIPIYIYKDDINSYSLHKKSKSVSINEIETFEHNISEDGYLDPDLKIYSDSINLFFNRVTDFQTFKELDYENKQYIERLVKYNNGEVELNRVINNSRSSNEGVYYTSIITDIMRKLRVNRLKDFIEVMKKRYNKYQSEYLKKMELERDRLEKEKEDLVHKRDGLNVNELHKFYNEMYEEFQLFDDELTQNLIDMRMEKLSNGDPVWFIEPKAGNTTNIKNKIISILDNIKE